MRKKLFILLPFLLALFLGITSANAALLDPILKTPDITSNSTGAYNYDASTGLFTHDATPLTITFDGTTLIDIVDPTTANGGLKDFSLSFLVDNSGDFLGGDDSRSDLLIFGSLTDGVTTYDGLLLSGEVYDFGWFDVPGDFALFDLKFDVTGGLLASFFTYDIGATKIASEISTFSGDWTVDHSGTKVKNDTAPVPIATSFLLFGTGAIGLVGFWRRFGK